MLKNSFSLNQLDAVPRAWVHVYTAIGSEAAFAHLIKPVCGEVNRASTDALAAWHRWCFDKMPGWCPASIFWLEVLFRARSEVLSGQDLPGMRSNLALVDELVPTENIARPLYLVSRQIFSGSVERLEKIYSGSECIRKGPEAGIKGFWARLLGRDSRSAPPEDSIIVEALQEASIHLEDESAFVASIQSMVKLLADWYQPDLGQESGITASGLGEKNAKESAGLPATPNSENLPDEPEIQASFSAQIGRGGYRVYSTSLDQAEPAAKWLTQLDIDALAQLDLPQRQVVRRLSHRLQRRLQAARLRHWSFDLEEGHLDSRRLARLIGQRPDRNIFRAQSDGLVQDACVCLLVDQSGSMRGSRQQMAALAIDLAVHTLEIVGISCEVLGYTTRYRDDSPLKQHWERSGQPPRPGRLNALRHIVFKQVNQPWRRARKNLGLLLRTDFGKENIDGEAILWAGRRLLSCKESKKIIVVLSDGVPFDRVTAVVMGREFLESHLRQAISASEAQGIMVMAIGTGQSVGAFYQRAVTVKDSNGIPAALMKSLDAMLVGGLGGQR